MNIQRGIDLDRVGAVASGICAVHCLLTGVALGVLSVVGLGFFGSPTTEFAFLSFALVIGSFAVWSGKRKHGSWAPSVIFCSGIACWILGHVVFGHHHTVEPADLHSMLGTVFSVGGGLCLVTFHIVNQRLIHQRSCSCA